MCQDSPRVESHYFCQVLTVTASCDQLMPPPPFYVLLAHSPLSNVPSGALSNTLAHPAVQYHYADDSPLSILPAHPDEHVLILNYDPNSTQPTIQSISDSLVTTGLSLEEAPGAAADDSKLQKNTSMFVIETTTNDQYVDVMSFCPDTSHFASSLVSWSHLTQTGRHCKQR